MSDRRNAFRPSGGGIRKQGKWNDKGGNSKWSNDRKHSGSDDGHKNRDRNTYSNEKDFKRSGFQIRRSKFAPRDNSVSNFHRPPASTLDVVVVPIVYARSGQKETVYPYCERCVEMLGEAGLRAWMDNDKHMLVGRKFNYWEFAGVKHRIEVGVSEVEHQNYVLATVTQPGQVATKETFFKEDFGVMVAKIKQMLDQQEEKKLKKKKKKGPSEPREPQDDHENVVHSPRSGDKDREVEHEPGPSENKKNQKTKKEKLSKSETQDIDIAVAESFHSAAVKNPRPKQHEHRNHAESALEPMDEPAKDEGKPAKLKKHNRSYALDDGRGREHEHELAHKKKTKRSHPDLD